MKDLNEIVVFARVAQQGSFSRAAKALGMPLSTVSRKVSDLEARLGISLMQRSTRKLQLTNAGEIYYRYCADLLQGLDEAETRVTQMHQQPEGRLRLTVPLGMASGSFADFLSRFARKYTRIEIDLVISNRFVDIIGENIDLAIRFGPLEDSALVAKRLGTSHLLLVSSPEYLKKHGSPKTPDDLANFDCLSFLSRMGGTSWEFMRDKALKRVQVKGQVQASDMGALKELALRGHGITRLPEMYCQAEIKAGLFRQLLPEWRSAPAPVHVVYANRRYLPARLSVFIEELQQWDGALWERLGKL